MDKVDPALLTLIASSGLLAALVQLVLALATFIRQRANAATLGNKMDENTGLTKDIHAVTNGPLSAMGQNITQLAVQAASNAAEARSTAEAAKVQANTDANASKES
jgi:hypothetical protein